ncbi:antitoxin Xre/MbcA/ParS toxin-binding domain-containing protein [Pseudomonas panipatensis]|uniref:antitoxin Xre/MbcA/ParS toxin-binding domain-containing protein n=1 Tax=Pseudomonas panipatensis TaxID=428992 RepID=UPI0035B26CDD
MYEKSLPGYAKCYLAHKQRLVSDGQIIDCAELERTARVWALAELLFADTNKAARWLAKPQQQLGGKSPLQQLATLNGARQVEHLLLQGFEGFVF